MTPSEALLDFGKPVAFYPGLVKHFGSVNAVLFFCQIFFHKGKEAFPELGVYKTSTEVEQETGLTRDEQKTARQKLKDCGVLIETEKRLEHKLFFLIDMGNLNKLIDGEIAPPESGIRPSRRVDSTFAKGKSRVRVLTEITTEKTSESFLPKGKPSVEKEHSLHHQFHKEFNNYYRSKNGVDAPWDEKESGRLSKWMKANPTITKEQWLKILKNRHCSPVSHAKALSAWVGVAVAWLNGLADDWGKQLTGNVPTGKADRNLAILASSLERGKHKSGSDEDGLFLSGESYFEGRIGTVRPSNSRIRLASVSSSNGKTV